VTSLDEVAGSALTSPVSAGTPLTQTAYRTGASAVNIPSGHVAITLPQTDKLGVAQNVAVGSTLAAYVIEDETCRLLTADVLVIATDSTSSTSTYLTFALLPEDVAAFATAHSANTLRLVQPADDVLTLDAGAAPASVAPVEANAVEAVAAEDSAVGAATTSDTSSVASTTATDAASTAQSSRDSQTDGTTTASLATTQEGGTSS
jgi:pilus assembly protein CpaB